VLDGLRLEPEDRRVLAEDPHRDGRDDGGDDAARHGEPQLDHGPHARLVRRRRRHGGRVEQVARLPEPVFDLRDRRHDEAVEVLDHAAAGRKDAAYEPRRSRLADELGVGAVRVPVDVDLDLVLALRGPEEAAVEERGVRHVERVLERVPERPRERDRATDRRVPVVDGREAVRRARGRHVGRRVDPHEAVLLDGRIQGRAPRFAVGLGRERRHEPACASAVEAPAVVAALEDPVGHAARRQRYVPVRTAVEQRGGAALAIAEEHERHVLQCARATGAQLGRLAEDEPVMGR
jgi:hypothetical protein